MSGENSHSRYRIHQEVGWLNRVGHHGGYPLKYQAMLVAIEADAAMHW